MYNRALAEEICKALSSVKHPAIDCSLVDLGIVKDVAAEDGEIIITMALPFHNIPSPVKNHLIQSVKQPVEELGVTTEVMLTVMDQEQLQKFLAIEKERWKGGT